MTDPTPVLNPYTALAGAIANHAATVTGLKTVLYPPEDSIQYEETPVGVVYLGTSGGESVINPDMDGETHHPFISLQVMVPREGNTADEFAEIDALIWPICKAFNSMTSVNAEPAFRDIGFHVDKCQIRRWRGSLNISYGGMSHYGAEFYFDIKFHG